MYKKSEILALKFEYMYFVIRFIQSRLFLQWPWLSSQLNRWILNCLLELVQIYTTLSFNLISESLTCSKLNHTVHTCWKTISKPYMVNNVQFVLISIWLNRSKTTFSLSFNKLFHWLFIKRSLWFCRILLSLFQKLFL